MHATVLLCPANIVLLLIPTSSHSCSLSASSSMTIPELWGEGDDLGLPFRAKHSTDLLSLHFDLLWLSVLIAKIRFADEC